MDTALPDDRPPAREDTQHGRTSSDPSGNTNAIGHDNTATPETLKHLEMQGPTQLVRKPAIGMPSFAGLKDTNHRNSITSRYSRASALGWIQVVVAIVVIGLTSSLFGKSIRTDSGRRHSVFTKIHGFTAVTIGFCMGIACCSALAFIIRPWPRNSAAYTPNIPYMTVTCIMSSLWLVATAMTLYCIGKGHDWVNDETLPSSSRNGYSQNEVADMLWPRLIGTAALSLAALLLGLAQIYQILRLRRDKFTEDEQMEAKQALFKISHK